MCIVAQRDNSLHDFVHYDTYAQLYFTFQRLAFYLLPIHSKLHYFYDPHTQLLKDSNDA